jgi:hypothetical protein
MDSTFKNLGLWVEPSGLGVDAQGARMRRLKLYGVPSLIMGLRGAP